MQLLLHPRNAIELAALAKQPPHGLLLVGPAHFGKHFVASQWAAKLTEAKLINYISPDEKTTISIEAVRELYRRTRSRQPGRQVIVIDHGESLGIEAQNALLKLLEEPRRDTHFVLTTPSTDLLLPTIVSRLQTVQLQPITSTQMNEWLQQTHKELDSPTRTKLLFIADGRPAMAHTLCTDKTFFAAQNNIMQRAKQLLAADAYERLILTNDLAKDRPALVATLEAMAQMVRLQLGQGKNEQRWLALADALQLCLARLAQNGNPRAQLTALCLT